MRLTMFFARQRDGLRSWIANNWDELQDEVALALLFLLQGK
jgi:hypothetical protein